MDHLQAQSMTVEDNNWGQVRVTLNSVGSRLNAIEVYLNKLDITITEINRKLTNLEAKR